MERGGASWAGRDGGRTIDVGFEKVAGEDPVENSLCGAIIRKEFMALLNFGSGETPSAADGAR